MTNHYKFKAQEETAVLETDRPQHLEVGQRTWALMGGTQAAA